MTLRELLENSNLAALGLLDPEDHAQFERALSQAPEQVRRHVIEEQARWAGGEMLLPSAEVPADLKARVMDSVKAAMIDASIAADDFSLLREQHGLSGRKVSSGWRTASFGLIAAVIALGGAFFYVYDSNVRSKIRVDENDFLTRYASSFGPQFADVIFDAATSRSILTSSDETFGGEVTIYSHPDWDDARIATRKLPTTAGDNYRLVELDVNNNIIRQIAIIEGGTQAKVQKIGKLASGTKVALIRAKVGEKAENQDHLMTGSVA
ncbi:MAG: hypothetical protein U0640_12790 [Phycisphaerales bacterium]